MLSAASVVFFASCSLISTLATLCDTCDTYTFIPKIHRLFSFEDLQRMTDWFARPVLHVTDVEASLRFYIDRLGFTCPWRYDDEAGRAYVAQVDRQGCALILAKTWPEKVGKGLMFISLNVEPDSREATTAAVDALRAELEAKGVPVKDGSWGYRLLVVDDPDGNQLFFNYPAETAS